MNAGNDLIMGELASEETFTMKLRNKNTKI